MEKSDYNEFGIRSSNNIDNLKKILVEIHKNDSTLFYAVPVCSFELTGTLEILLRGSSDDTYIIVRNNGD